MQEFRDWKVMPDGPEKYAKYLCSREWGVKRDAVRRRSGGTCERCKRNKASQCHHLTYLRKYNEPLTDLQDLCGGCHEFSHGRSNVDPAAEPGESPSRPMMVRGGNVSCPKCCGERDNVHMVAVEVIQGTVMATVTHENVDVRQIVQADWRNGSQVDLFYACECGHQFLWSQVFGKGVTSSDVKDTPGHMLRDDELWRR